MKKMLLAVSVCCIQYAQAQTIIDFEDLNVPGIDTAWLGSDLSGGFNASGIFFENAYNNQWGYWEAGFIYSNSTDNTTPGYTNDYSSFAGSGANGSANYAVNYGEVGIDFTTEKFVASIAITNNTYAALSMKNGDAFGKQFGSVNNAQGNPDGTNGEDFFRLLLIGKNAQGDVTDTVLFYLADYRFADDAQDYIIDSWEIVDLTPLGAIRYLDFKLESSDVSSFGNNTPSYFALDNIVITNGSTASISQKTLTNASVFPNPTRGILSIDSEGGNMHLVSANGQTILEKELNGTETIDLSNYPSGIYFVEITSEKGFTRTRVQKI